MTIETYTHTHSHTHTHPHTDTHPQKIPWSAHSLNNLEGHFMIAGGGYFLHVCAQCMKTKVQYEANEGVAVNLM